MHPEVENYIERVKKANPEYFINTKVLEVGSLDINGSIRRYFTDCNYTGLDIGEGKGVDVVCPIHLFNHEFKNEDKYDVVISTEMLEHDQYWKDSLMSMYMNLKSGGLLILTCAGPGRHEHGTIRTTPQDSPFTTEYYRNISVQDVRSVLNPDLFENFSIEYSNNLKTDLYFHAIKL